MIRFFLAIWLCLSGLNASEYVQTPEDKQRSHFFQGLFEHSLKVSLQSSDSKTPQTLHVIWLGPKPFPAHSVAFVEKWIDLHPEWTVKFWTDLPRSLPDARMQLVLFDQFPLEDLKDLYLNCENFGERSQILRYAILLKEGGVYIDHDMKPLKSIEKWQKGFDFFCGLEPLDSSVLSSNVYPGVNLIGACPQHPILVETLSWLKSNSERIEIQFPGQDPSSLMNRVLHRSTRALDRGIEQAINRPGFRNVILPSSYFNSANPKEAVYALHEHAQTWVKKNSEESNKIQKGFNSLQKRQSSTLQWLLCLGLLNIVLAACLLKKLWKVA